MIFRKVFNLEEFFQDHRKLCYLLLDVNKHKTISDVEQHIKTVFGISDAICLFEDDVLLPQFEEIKLLTFTSGIIIVKKLNVVIAPSAVIDDERNTETKVFNINEDFGNQPDDVQETSASVHGNCSYVKKRRKSSFDVFVSCGASLVDNERSERKRNKKCKKSKRHSEEQRRNGEILLNGSLVNSNDNNNDEDVKQTFEIAVPDLQTTNNNEPEPSTSNYISNVSDVMINPDMEVEEKPNCSLMHFTNEDLDEGLYKTTKRKRQRKRRKRFTTDVSLELSIVNQVCKTENKYSERSAGSSQHIRFDNEDESDVLPTIPKIEPNSNDSTQTLVACRSTNGIEEKEHICNNIKPCQEVNGDENVSETVSNVIPKREAQGDVGADNKANEIVTEAWFNALMKVKEAGDKPPVFRRTPKSNTLTNGHCSSQENGLEDGSDLSNAKHTLQVDDIVIFKILILSKEYTPTVSDSVIGRVISVSEELIKLKMLFGREICKPLTGKFSLCGGDKAENDGETHETVNEDVIELLIKDLIDPRKVTNPFDMFNNSV